ncbi:MAG: hypothetical protein ACQESR_01480 [Planctomycetota bacterium]
MFGEFAIDNGQQAVTVFAQGCSRNINPACGQSEMWREKAAVFAEAAVDAAQRAVPIQGPVPVSYDRRHVLVPRRDPADQRAGAITRLGWRRESFESAEKGMAKLPDTREVPVSAARIAPLGIATNAGELFVEWGIDIKKRSPVPHTIVCGPTNDWIGYEPTAQAFAHEGHEALAGVNFVSLKGIKNLVNTALERLVSER